MTAAERKRRVAASARKWREANREKYREYNREWMRRKRRKLPTKGLLRQVGTVEVLGISVRLGITPKGSE